METKKLTPKENEISINQLEAQQICFALEHELKSIMQDKNNDLEWILYKTRELVPIYFKYRKIMNSDNREFNNMENQTIKED